MAYTGREVNNAPRRVRPTTDKRNMQTRGMDAEMDRRNRAAMNAVDNDAPNTPAPRYNARESFANSVRNTDFDPSWGGYSYANGGPWTSSVETMRPEQKSNAMGMIMDGSRQKMLSDAFNAQANVQKSMDSYDSRLNDWVNNMGSYNDDGTFNNWDVDYNDAPGPFYPMGYGIPMKAKNWPSREVAIAASKAPTAPVGLNQAQNAPDDVYGNYLLGNTPIVNMYQTGPMYGDMTNDAMSGSYQEYADYYSPEQVAQMARDTDANNDWTYSMEPSMRNQYLMQNQDEIGYAQAMRDLTTGHSTPRTRMMMSKMNGSFRSTNPQDYMRGNRHPEIVAREAARRSGLK